MANKENSNELDSSLKLIAKTSMIVFIGIILSKILTYIYRIIIARHFGPEVYGLFSLGLMILSLTVIFSKLGLPQGNLRYISFYRGKKQINKIRHIFQSSLILLFFSSIICGITLFFLSNFISINIFHNPDLIIFLKFFSMVVPLSVLLSIFIHILIAYEKISWFSFIFNVLQNLVKVIVIVFLIIIGFKINAVIFSYILGIFIAVVVAFFVCKYNIPEVFKKYKLNKKTKSKISKELFSYSWPLLFFGFIILMFNLTDSFVIGYLKTVKDVGFYNVAVNISLLLVIIPELFIHLFFPLVTKEYSKNNFKLIKELSQQVGKWIFILTLPLLILILLFPGALINILFGSQYLIAENALRFLSIGIFFAVICTISRNLLSMLGKSKLILFDIILASTINIILNFILISKYGINGAAIATMVSIIFLNLIFLFQARHYLSFIPLRRKVINVFIVSIISTTLLILIKTQFTVINIFNLILFSSFFIFSYIILMFVTSCLDKEDIMILKAIKGKLKFYKKSSTHRLGIKHL